MSNDHRCVFHQMREQAEQAAATRAVCEMTRTLHLQLADLHAAAARQIQMRLDHNAPKPLIFEFVNKRWPARKPPQTVPVTTAVR